MEINEKVNKVLQEKGFSDELIKYALKLLPEMIKIFGEEKIIKFFKEYQFSPIDENTKDSEYYGYCGATNRKTKKIEFFWKEKNLSEALTVFLHEAGHAIGHLETNEDSFLMEGYNMRENFLAKLEEAIVSERSDEIEFGELDYRYMEMWNPENGEIFHKNDFKTQPTAQYPINMVFYRNLQILLGNNRNLMNKMMFADNLEEKNKICNEIIELLKTQLSEEQFLKLKDCVNVCVLSYRNHGYKKTIYDKIKLATESGEKERYKKLLITNFPKNIKYCFDRSLEKKNIFSAIDDLCELTVDVLTERLEDNNYDEFSSVKETCEYFTKIYNNNESLSAKSSQLKKSLMDKINLTEPELISTFYNNDFNDTDVFKTLIPIISTSDFKEKDLKDFQIKDNSVIISNKEKYYIAKEAIYSNPSELTAIIMGEKPIGYKIELIECSDENEDEKDKQDILNEAEQDADKQDILNEAEQDVGEQDR